MLGRLSLIALLPAVLLAQPAAAITAKQKMETCKVGADDQKLTGKPRDAFIKHCMSGANYEPQARRDAMKATAKTKKASAKPKPKATPKATPAAAPAPMAPPPGAPAGDEQPK
ncbi:MAG TPA: PsiF family protein [Pseudolabrys sp.]|nr:PsiF family protein [Pseudolabrys sp.]